VREKAAIQAIELDSEQTSALIERIQRRSLEEKDYEIFLSVLQMIAYLQSIVSQKSQSILRLVRSFFGVKTESAKNVLKSSPKQSCKKTEDSRDEDSAPQDKPSTQKGHGRNGAASYPKASRIEVPHESLKVGDPCSLCPKGRLYSVPPSVIVRMRGHAPVEALIYELEKLRCSSCGALFTAGLPAQAGEEKYDESAGSVIACMKYGAGIPFYRLERLQQSMQTPLPASTQWDVVEHVADEVHPVYPVLITKGAQGNIVHNDDTTMRVLALSRELASQDAERKGIFTSAVVSISEGHKIALFFTGNRHAGENLDLVLSHRAKELDAPIQMSDAQPCNNPQKAQTTSSNCLSHARRNFVDVHSSFPDEVAYVIETIGKIYHFDDLSKKQNHSANQRLEFHQVHSAPVMEELKRWCTDQIEQKKVEPNSGLGQAITYMLKRWDKFTLFLRLAGAPLDNNICERVLKLAVLHRKNSLFYRTEHGAYIGDMFMSIYHTCLLCGANPFEYLVTLQKHASEVRKQPELWLPWNYTDMLDPPPS